MSKAVTKIQALFKSNPNSFTLKAIKELQPDLKASEISMALCYLKKQRYVSRQAVTSNTVKGRKQVWSYTYHAEKLPVENTNEN
jgi:hypothetical protein